MFYRLFLLCSLLLPLQTQADTDKPQHPEALQPAKPQSGIQLSAITPQQLDNLVLLGKFWGFIKYHHPAVAGGQYDWDAELLRLLPDYLAAANAQQRDGKLSAWLTELGQVPDCPTCQSADASAVLTPDLGWIDRSSLSVSLKQQLHHLYYNRHQGSHHYIGAKQGVGNPEFLNEAAYQQMAHPDDEYRLLALYRYWNMIHYFFPNKHLTDTPWEHVLEKHLPAFIAAANELQYQQALVRLFAEINDSHAFVGRAYALQDWKGQFFPPVRLAFVENRLVVIDHYKAELQETSGLRRGDIITRLNGEAIADWVQRHRALYPASNQSRQYHDMAIDLLRADQPQLTLDYMRDGRAATLTLKLHSPEEAGFYSRFKPDKNGQGFELIDSDIGYINLAHTKREDLPGIRQQLKGTRGVVIDIRNYPADFVVMQLGAMFSSTRRPFVRFSLMNANNPGEFSFGYTEYLAGDNSSYRGQVVVLVNEETLSQAEYTAMALRAGDNTWIIGSTTAGADGNVSTIVLPGGISTGISGIGVYYPDGSQTQRVGIIPDVIVKPTIAGIKAGRDEILEKALALIKS